MQKDKLHTLFGEKLSNTIPLEEYIEKRVKPDLSGFYIEYSLQYVSG